MHENFIKTKVIYRAMQHIADKKQEMLRDLVAYIDDPVRYRRRLRFLQEITKYEYDLLCKFINFQTEYPADDFDESTLKKIIETIDLLTLQNA